MAENKNTEKLVKGGDRAGKLELDLRSKNVVFYHDDCVNEGRKLPMNVVHIFNQDKNSLLLTTESDSTFSKDVGMGKGWRCNLHRYVFKKTETVDGNTQSKYIYVDHLAKEHEFLKYNANTEMYFNDNLCLYENNGTVVIKDKTGNKMTFDTYGRLERIYNSRGSANIRVYYSGENFDQISSVKEGSGRQCSFHYENFTINGEQKKLLKKIVYQNIVYVEFSYDQLGRLVEIKYPSEENDTDAVNNKTTFSYKTNSELESVRDRTGKKITIEKTSSIIRTLIESTNVSCIKNGQVVNATEEIEGERTVVKYSGDRTFIDTVDGKRTVYVFDIDNKLVGKYVIKNQYEIGTNSTQNAKLESISCGGAEVNFYADNKYTDGDFELGTASYENGTISTEQKFTGNKSLQFNAPTAQDKSDIGRINLNMTTGKRRTISFMYKVSAISKTQGDSKVIVSVKYSNNTEETHQIPLNETSICWQPMIINVGKNYITRNDGVKSVKLEFDVSGRSLFIDHVTLQDIDVTVVRTEVAEECFAVGENGEQRYTADDIVKIYYEDKDKCYDKPQGENDPKVTKTDLWFMKECMTAGILVPIVVNGADIHTTSVSGNGASLKIKMTDGTIRGLGDFVDIYDLIESNKEGTQTTKVVSGGKTSETKTVDGMLKTSTYETNAHNQVVSTVDFNGKKTEFTYDDYGNVTKKKVTSGTQSIEYNYEYADNGNTLSKMHDGRGTSAFTNYTTSYTCNNMGNVTQIVEPSNKITNFVYDLENRLKTMTSHGTVTEYSYTRGLLTKVRFDAGFCQYYDNDPKKSNLEIEYDGFGVIVAYYIDNVKVQWYNYKKNSDYSSTNEDTFNYVVSGIEYNYNPFAEKMIFARDGSLICVKKGTFNSQGNFVSQKEILRVTYDSRGRVATVTDSNTTTPQVYTYSYKEDGSVEKVVKTGFGEIETSQNVLEEHVNLVKYSNYNSATGGNVYEYLKVYDRIKSITLPRNSETENGKKIEYTYDGFNRITRKSRDFSQGLTSEYKLTEEYKYNKNYLSEIVVTDVEGKRRKEVYDYDNRGNVFCYAIELIDDEGFPYDMAQLANYTYDEQNRLVREENMALGFSKVYYYDDGGNIQNIYEYEYNGEFIGKYSFIYAENYNSCHKNYLTNVYYSTEFDGLGTLIDEWSLFDAFTRLSWHNGVGVEYDSSGRIIKHGETLFEYDCNGIRQRKVRTITNGDVYREGYQTDNITDHVYYTEGSIIHKEVISQKRVVTEIVGREEDGLIFEDFVTTETDLGSNTLEYYYDESGICAIKYNGQNYHFQKNAFGDVVRILGWDGFPVSEYIYDAWGNCKAIDLNGVEIVDSSHIANVNPFRYRGYYFDTETGFYYLESRYYNPKTCRFVTPDAIGYLDPSLVGGLNLYTYCSNNPVMFTDCHGTTQWWEWLIACVIVIGCAIGAVFTGKTPLIGSAFVGAVISGGVSLIKQGITSGELDWEGFLVDLGGGFVSGAFGYGAGKALGFAGKTFGYSLGKSNILGINVGKTFGYFGGSQFLMKTFGSLGTFVGEIAGGYISDKYLTMSASEREEKEMRKLSYDIVFTNIVSKITSWMGRWLKYA